MGSEYPATHLFASLRWDGSGEPPAVQVDESAFLQPRRRLILLVHGYNVSHNRARRAFKRFETEVRWRSVTLADDIGWLLWYSDWGIPLVSFASYPFKAKSACSVGRKVATFLRNRKGADGNPPEIVLVAHSLGCRVTLEALNELHRSGGDHVSVLLMAAAVSVDDLVPGGRLRDAALYAKRRAVLHSTSDFVLRVPFRIGEFSLGAAVGTQGMPSDLWLDSDAMQGFGHSSYWSSQSTAAWFVAWMRRSVPRPSRSPPTASRHAPVRAMPPPRALPSRDVMPK